MCTCGYTPFLDRSFTPESFNTLSRASSSWTHFVKRPFNHLALCGWCSTLRVGTCSTSVSTSMGSISPHSRDTLITSPRTLRVVLDSTRRHVLNLLLALPGFVSPQSRDPLSRLWVRLPPFPTSSSQKSSVLSLSRWHRSLCLRGALLDLLSTRAQPFVGTFLYGVLRKRPSFGILSPSLSLTPPLSQVSLQKAYTAGASSPVDHINPSAHDSPPRCHCLVVSLTHTP